MCVCIEFVMSGYVYLWVMYCAVACIYGFFNVWLCLSMGFVMCGCVCMGFVMCGCVYEWIL